MRVKKRMNKATLSVAGFVASLLMSTNVHAATNGIIAYSCRGEDGNQNICFINPDGSGKIQFTSGGFNGLPSWSPDGKMLAYSNYDPLNGLTSIMVTNKDVFQPKFISPGVAPAWSPNGKDIAFSKPTDTPPTHTLENWAIHPDGTNLRQLTTPTSASNFAKRLVTWSPGGTFIAYAHDELAPGHPPPGPPVHLSIWVTKLVGEKGSDELTVGFCNF